MKKIINKIKIFLKKFSNKIKKIKQEFSSIHSVYQVYQSSLINLPKHIFNCENNIPIDIERTNEIISSQNTIMGLTNIILQISLKRGKSFNDMNNNLLNIFADLGRYFTTVLSKDKETLYISGSVLDYISFFKYTRDYGNPFVKAILKEINENTYKQPFKELIEDEFMNERKFLVSYEHDTELEWTDCGHYIKILEMDDFIGLNNHFFEKDLNAYEIGKLCNITLQFGEEFNHDNSFLYKWLLRIAKTYYFSSTFTVMKFSITDLMEFLMSPKYIKSTDKYKTELDLVKKNILYDELFFDKELFTARYKLEQINPENPDEEYDEEIEEVTTKENRKTFKNTVKTISDEDAKNNMENYINNIDNPNGSMTNINLDNFYDEDETYDPDDYV